MNELSAILKAAAEADQPAFLATVVDVHGSSYRRPGARMLILSPERHVGMISGGCRERDLCRQAATLCRNGAQLISFDTRSESTDFKPRYNSGCSGIIYILVEPVTGDASCPLRRVSEIIREGRADVLGTVYHSDSFDRLQIGTRFNAEEAGSSLAIDRALNEAFEQVGRSGKPVCCQIVAEAEGVPDACARILVEKISPPRPFWIFGGGDDAIPLAAMARELGWAVTVVDHRATNLTVSRFPDVSFVHAADPDSVRQNLVATPDTAAVMMTRDIHRDVELLPWLCNSVAGYVGLLGPKSRTAKLIRKMHQLNSLPESDRFEKLRTPVGLDIGAANPAEIAVSILAEVIAAGTGRDGNALSLRSQPIHEPVSHRLIEPRSDVVQKDSVPKNSVQKDFVQKDSAKP